MLTSAALAALRDDELAAVLAHEQAHLPAGTIWSLPSPMPYAGPSPEFRCSGTLTMIARLVEMLADDIASVGHGRLTVAAAMAVLVSGGAPAAALAAGGPTALSRARRLLTPLRPLPPRCIAAGFALAVAVAVLPVMAMASLWTDDARGCRAHWGDTRNRLFTRCGAAGMG